MKELEKYVDRWTVLIASDDMWRAGLILVELLLGTPLHIELKNSKVPLCTVWEKGRVRELLCRAVKRVEKSSLESLLLIDQGRRSMLQLDPRNRLTSSEALELLQEFERCKRDARVRRETEESVTKQLEEKLALEEKARKEREERERKEEEKDQLKREKEEKERLKRENEEKKRLRREMDRLKRENEEKERLRREGDRLKRERDAESNKTLCKDLELVEKWRQRIGKREKINLNCKYLTISLVILRLTI